MEARRDNRASPRVGVTQLVVGLADGDRFARGNISSGGVGFELEELVALHAGDPVAVRFVVPETMEPLVLSAVVVHTSYRRGEGSLYVGAAFVDVDELVQNPLDRFVEEAVLLAKTPPGGVRLPNP